jgi:hypothetical protein
MIFLCTLINKHKFKIDFINISEAYNLFKESFETKTDKILFINQNSRHLTL